MGEEIMKLYGGPLSPFVMRALLAARAKGLDLPTEMPEGGIKSQSFLKLNPMGKMPCLVDGDFALPESSVIIDYLDEAGSGAPLYPSDPKERARVRLLARMADLYLVPELTVLFRARENPDAVPAAMSKLGEALANLEQFRRDSDQFAVGDSFTAADATLIPIFFFFDAFDATMQTGRLLDALPRLKAWWERVKASDLGRRAVEEQGAALEAFLGQR
jgi:glutathione S-transferase